MKVKLPRLLCFLFLLAACAPAPTPSPTLDPDRPVIANASLAAVVFTAISLSSETGAVIEWLPATFTTAKPAPLSSFKLFPPELLIVVCTPE